MHGGGEQENDEEMRTW